ncbi:3795_t:CDS:1, partial [Gigaspora margarita]
SGHHGPNDLPNHTTKKVKATLPEDTPATTIADLLPTQTSLTQNNEKLEL